MTQEELKRLLDNLRALPGETEWVEFKVNYYTHQTIGEYISALANSACLHQQDFGYLVFGIENKAHAIQGTTFKPRQEKVGNEELENWLARLLTPRVDFKIIEFNYEGVPIVIFKIDSAHNIPVRFKGIEYIRIGSYKKKLADHPEKARKIWNSSPTIDWSVNGKITNTAIVLLGKPESTHFISPTVARITWKLEGPESAYEPFDPPFYVNINKVRG